MCIPYSHYYISLDSNYCYRLIAAVAILWDAVDDFSHAFDSSAWLGLALLCFAVRFGSPRLFPLVISPCFPFFSWHPVHARVPSVNARTCLMIRKWFPVWFHHSSYLPPPAAPSFLHPIRRWLKFYAKLAAPNWLCKNSPNESLSWPLQESIPYSLFRIPPAIAVCVISTLSRGIAEWFRLKVWPIICISNFSDMGNCLTYVKNQVILALASLYNHGRQLQWSTHA